MYFDQNCINLKRIETSVTYLGLPHIPPVIQRTSFKDDAQRLALALLINSLFGHSCRHKVVFVVSVFYFRLSSIFSEKPGFQL